MPISPVPEKIAEWQQLEDRLVEPGNALDRTGLYLLRGKFVILDKETSYPKVTYVVRVSDVTGRQSPRFSIYLSFVESDPSDVKKAFRDLPKSLPECVLGVSVVRQNEFSTRRVVNYASFPGRFTVVLKHGKVTDYEQLRAEPAHVMD